MNIDLTLLRGKRKRAGLTMQELAKKLGVKASSTIYHWETNPFAHLPNYKINKSFRKKLQAFYDEYPEPDPTDKPEKVEFMHVPSDLIIAMIKAGLSNIEMKVMLLICLKLDKIKPKSLDVLDYEGFLKSDIFDTIVIEDTLERLERKRVIRMMPKNDNWYISVNTEYHTWR